MSGFNERIKEVVLSRMTLEEQEQARAEAEERYNESIAAMKRWSRPFAFDFVRATGCPEELVNKAVETLVPALEQAWLESARHTFASMAIAGMARLRDEEVASSVEEAGAEGTPSGE